MDSEPAFGGRYVGWSQNPKRIVLLHLPGSPPVERNMEAAAVTAALEGSCGTRARLASLENFATLMVIT